MGVNITKGYSVCRQGFALVAGTGSGSAVAVDGILTTDELIGVVEIATSTAIPTDRTSLATISANGVIKVGVDTNSDQLWVTWISTA